MALPQSTTGTDPSRLLTIEQVSELISIAPATIYRLLARGDLIAIKVGTKARRIPARCLEAYIEARIAEATADLPQPMRASMRVRPNRRRAQRGGVA